METRRSSMTFTLILYKVESVIAAVLQRYTGP